MRLLVFLVLSFLYLGVQAQVYFTKDGHITFFSSAPLEDIKAHNERVTSFIDMSKGTLVFKVPIRSFQFKKSLMQEHFNEKYMETDEYPTATFKGKIVDFDPEKFKPGQTYEVKVKGDLEIHGVTKERVVDGKITVSKNSVESHSVFMIAVADHDIKIPSLLTENIAEEVEVTVDINYDPFKKN